MARSLQRTEEYFAALLQDADIDTLKQRLRPQTDDPAARLPRNHKLNSKLIARRWAILGVDETCQEELWDSDLEKLEQYQNNIENFIGTVKVPVGIAGPLRVRGLFANDDYYLPLATTEAALVASYHRGCQLISAAGGCSAMLLSEGVSRAPGFVFKTVSDAGEFVLWALSKQETFKEVAESTTRHGKLCDCKITIEGNHVYINFDYMTGDAAGQNMVTIATAKICHFISEHSPVAIEAHYVEANLSGDKKASSQSFMSVRGKKVTAEVSLPAQLVKKVLHCTPEQLSRYGQISSIGGALSGTIGLQGHYANGLTALFIACGQDAACVSEAAVGVTRFEVDDEGSLYAAVTLPNLIVGTVGGGTGLPSQRACLELLGLAGSGKARAFAEVCAALVLAGELSIAGALCAGHFAKAHKRLARS